MKIRSLIAVLAFTALVSCNKDKEILNTLNEYNTSTIGVTVVVPLYSGGRIEAETQKARINIQLAKQEQSSKILAFGRAPPKEEPGAINSCNHLFIASLSVSFS